jgi:type III secretion protein V
MMLAIMLLMVIPLPAWLLDVLIAFNITLAVLLLMSAIYLRDPTDFSTFPSIILLATSFRLAISVATTRQILTTANGGEIIETFGNFVVMGNLVVGMVIFLIITIVQFIVVTKGAERIAEVSARFALDAMPGKQMSIDADVRAGTVDSETGASRRAALDKSSQFFGAMDGAMKFVKGDAIAGIIIVLVNLFGGIAIGVGMQGLPFSEALRVYSILTIGDGLVAQVPALFMAMCAGAIVTRVTHSGSSDLGSEIGAQLLSDRRPLFLASIIALLMATVPGFPSLTFVTLAGALFFAALFVRRSEQQALAREAEANAPIDEGETPAGRRWPELADGEPMKPVRSWPILPRLIIRAGTRVEAELTQANFPEARADSFRAYAARIGFRIPAPPLEVAEDLAPDAVHFELDAVPLLRAVVPPNCDLVRCDLEVAELLSGKDGVVSTPANWPAAPGFWLPREMIAELGDQLQSRMSPAQALAEAAVGFTRLYSSEIISRVEIGAFQEFAVKSDPSLMDPIFESLPGGSLQELITRLVAEEVPLRPSRVFFEGLLQELPTSRDINVLHERMRQRLKRQITYHLADDAGVVPCLLFDPKIEASLSSAIQAAGQKSNPSGQIIVDPKLSAALREALHRTRQKCAVEGKLPAIVTQPNIRSGVRQFLKGFGLLFPVVSYSEIDSMANVQPIEIIKTPAAS